MTWRLLLLNTLIAAAVAHASKESAEYTSRKNDKSKRNLIGYNPNFQGYQHGTPWYGYSGPTGQTEDQCLTGPEETLNTTCFFSFMGRPEDLTAEDVVVLTEAFLSAYNDLGATRCFEAVDVIIDTSQDMNVGSRYLADTTGNVTFSFNFSFFFSIVFRCAFCPSGSTLFTVDGGRRRLMQRRELVQKVRRNFANSPYQIHYQQQQQQFQDNIQQQQQQIQQQQQQNQNNIQQYQSQFQQQYQSQFPNFQLPHQYQPQPPQQPGPSQPLCSVDNVENCIGPSRENFVEHYNSVFQLLRDEDNSSVDEIMSGCEVTTKPCDPIVTEFDTSLEIIVMGDYDLFIQEQNNNNDLEAKVMEVAIKSTYNGLNLPNEDVCDLQFRRVSDVDYFNATRLSDDSFSMSFNVNYGCRGCESSDGVLSTVSDVEREDLQFDCRDEGPVVPMCTCAVGVISFRSPTAREFTKALQKTMEVRIEMGKLSFVTAVAGDDATTETTL